MFYIAQISQNKFHKTVFTIKVLYYTVLLLDKHRLKKQIIILVLLFGKKW